jgi:Fe-S-cluster containining protein
MDGRQHRLRIELFDQVRDLILPMPSTACSVTALMPAARTIVHAIADAAAKAALGEGKNVSCGPVCGACCRQLVPISLVEAATLVAAIDASPTENRERIRGRFSQAVHEMETFGILDPSALRPRLALRGHGRDSASLWLDVSKRYFAAAIACPILENESCSLYIDRPLVCRAYSVTSSPERCRHLDGGAEALPRPLDVEAALSETAHALEGSSSHLIPMTLAVEWVDNCPDAFAARHDAEAMLARLLDELLAQSRDHGVTVRR